MKYDLEDRTFQYSRSIIELVNGVPKTLASIEIAKQLIRAGCSVGANYIEANESLSKNDFLYRIKLCRKEAKESTYWLKLLEVSPPEDKDELINESIELTKIFGAIIRNTSQ